MNSQFNPQSPYAETQPIETQEENHFSALLEKKIVLPSAKKNTRKPRANKIAPLVDETIGETEITDPVALRAIEELYRAALDKLPEIDPLCPACHSRHGFHNLHRITSATA